MPTREVQRCKEGARRLTCFICGGDHIARNCKQINQTAAAVIKDFPYTFKERANKMLCAACCEIPLSLECEVIIEGNRVAAQRDPAASITIVQSDLVPECCKAGKTVEITLASSSEKRMLPIAMVKIDTPYFKGSSEVVLMKDPVHKVLIRNNRKEGGGVVSTILVYPVQEMYAAVQTRVSGRKSDKHLMLSQHLQGRITLEELR